jgi:hypothetical protein
MLAWIEILRARSSTHIQGQRPVQWVLSRQVQPVAFYAYLKSRFGDPNGFAMMLREPSVDNLIHWNFTLISGDTYLDISCLNTRMEIVLTGPFEGSVDELEKMLLEEFTHHRKAIAETKRGFERWHLFINPFARLKRLTDQQLERLTELDIPGLAVPHLDEAIHDAQSFHAKMKEVTTKCDEAMALTITLQMTAPILGESLVNFLILLLAKPEIRCDERMLDSYARQNIDVRIKSLPVILTIRWTEAVDRPLPDGKFTCHRSVIGGVMPLPARRNLRLTVEHWAGCNCRIGERQYWHGVCRAVTQVNGVRWQGFNTRSKKQA